MRCRTVIPEAPVPSWGDILRRFFGKKGMENERWLAWNNGGQEVRLFSRGSLSIAAVVDCILNARGKRTVTVFVPAYFCNATLNPVRRQGVRIAFYPIRENMRPDWPQVELLAREVACPDMFVLVHYFGFPCGGDDAYEYCRQVGAILMEDCAHVLFPTSEMGQRGHAVIYSPHKLLAVCDGGLLVINKERLAKEVNLERSGLEDSACLSSADDGVGFVAQSLWILKKMAQRACMMFRVPWWGEALSAHSYDGRGMIGRPRGMSTIAERMLWQFQDKLMAFALRRRHNFCLLNSFVLQSGTIVRPLFPALPVNSIPYCYPLLVQKHLVNRLYVRLNRAGVPARSWPDLPPEVKRSPRKHAVAIKLRESLITLPLHHSLSTEDILRIGQKLKAEVEKLPLPG